MLAANSPAGRRGGADARAPALSKLGGKAWQTLRSRVRTAVRELAGELLALYARRQSVTRPAFPEDDEMMARLEADFPFEETDDQQRAIDVVRRGVCADGLPGVCDDALSSAASTG